MKKKINNWILYTNNFMKLLKDRRHEQKSKSLAFALTYSILPILLLINLTIPFFPDSFFNVIEDLIELAPTQYQQIIINFLNNYSYQETRPILYILLVLFILYTVSSNVRLIIEIANDCYSYSQDRSKYTEILISALLFILIGFSLLFLFVIVIAGQALRSVLEINNVTNIAMIVSQILQMKSLITLITLFIIFFIIYYIAPNIKNNFKSTLVGALISTVGLFIASYGFEIYLAKSKTYELLYGAVYSQYLLFLFGMYITCQIIVISMIINGVIYDKISIKKYHIENSKQLIDIEFETMKLNNIEK